MRAFCNTIYPNILFATIECRLEGKGCIPFLKVTVITILKLHYWDWSLIKVIHNTIISIHAVLLRWKNEVSKPSLLAHLCIFRIHKLGLNQVWFNHIIWKILIFFSCI